MKVLMVTDHFHPDMSSGGRLWTELAAELVDETCHVHVLTGHSRYNTDAVAPAREEHKGIRIRRLNVPAAKRRGLISRALNELLFSMAAFLATMRVQRPDVILSLSSPPFLPPFMALASRLRRVPFVYVNYDIFPDIAVAMGLLKPGTPVVWTFERALRFALRHATRVVVIGRCMEDVVRAKLGRSRTPIDVIHNWSDSSKFYPVPRDVNPFFDRQPALRNAFVVQYSGNMGRFQDFDSILAAAERLKDETTVRFVLVGDGARRDWITDEVERRNLTNVEVLPFQPQAALNESLNAADVTLVTLERGAEGLGVPSKFYPILAVGKPVIALMQPHGEVARTVAAHATGVVVGQGDVDGLCVAILGLAADREKTLQMGLRARQLFLERFDKHVAIEEYRRALARAVAGG
ncbi:MAG TPA: glycosyltransferase family 4 protein [Gemmatimonadaceae bacterium]|nr:glycosyltransferase family 4 protein [Gemmatimonadaceae bacterium]